MAYPFPIEDTRFPQTFDAWRRITPTLFPVAELVPTQYYLRIDRILAIHRLEPPEGNDIPHAVRWQGVVYIYDGHHRWTLATMARKERIFVRILEL